MILFFFLLLMLAMAWGVADHYQSLISRVPPPAPAPARIEAPAPPAPAILPPVNAPVTTTEPADDSKSGDAVASEAGGKTDVDGGSAGKP